MKMSAFGLMGICLRAKEFRISTKLNRNSSHLKSHDISVIDWLRERPDKRRKSDVPLCDQSTGQGPRTRNRVLTNRGDIRVRIIQPLLSARESSYSLLYHPHLQPTPNNLIYLHPSRKW